MSDARRVKRRKRRDTRRAKRKIGTSNHVHRILRYIAHPILTIPFHVRGENLKVVKETARPYIILGNHTSVLDPFILTVVADIPVQYVVSDSQFRNRFISFWLGLVGSIPKTKVISDFDTVKHIVQIKKNKGIIGIFPEGQSSWDGNNLPLVKSTFKLIKSLKIPVIVARLRGAYLTWPRWSPRPRRGKVTIEFERILDTKTIRSLSVEEIEELITRKLQHNEALYQRNRQQRFSSPRIAEYLERALFACPSCGSFHTLESRKQRVTCSACGYTVHFSNTGFFESRRGKLRFDNVRDWNLWQQEELRSFLKRSVQTEESGELMVDYSLLFQTGYKTMELSNLGTGRMALYTDRIEVMARNGNGERPPLVIPLKDIEGLNVQNNEKLEFYAWDELYRIVPQNPRTNMYKWYLAVPMLQSLSGNGSEKLVQ